MNPDNNLQVSETISSERRFTINVKLLLKFEYKSNATNWFYRVVLHVAMIWQRKDQSRRVSHEGLQEVQSLGCKDKQALHRDTVEQLYKAIHLLPKTDTALVLLYLDELSYREMADVLGISENNVGVKLNQAKKTLNELMKGEFNGS